MRTPSASAPWGTPSTTSWATPVPRGPSALAAVLERLPPALRRLALTHRYWAGPSAPSYERLELLGDAVLQLAATEQLMRRHPEAAVGDLTWMRQRVVSGESCAAVAREAGLPDAFAAAAPRSGRAVARELAERPSVQAALAEAVIGAAREALGAGEAALVAAEAFSGPLAAAVPGQRDPKTALQEAAARRRLDVRYEVTAAEGTPQEPSFRTRVLVGGEPLGAGSGRSKQASEQAAAADALPRLAEGAPC
jgi:ribonuclease-3